MKAVLTNEGWRLLPDDAVTAGEATYAWEDAPAPSVSTGEIAVEGIEADVETRTARRVWTVRAKTEVESNVVIHEPQAILAALTNDEIWAMCEGFREQVRTPKGDVLRRVLLVLLSAPKVETRSDRAKGLVKALTGTGVMTIGRVRELLGDPGLS